MKRISKLVKIIFRPRLLVTLIRYGVAGAIEHEAILREIKCKNIVDIGANRGQFALVARYCLPKVDILSFEPLLNPSLKFQSIFEGDLGASLFQVAVGSISGEAKIHISKKDDSSSILPITNKQNELFPGTLEKGTTTIRIGRLKEFISEDQLLAPALLKLDVQGYELETLRGCTELLHKFDHIYAECSFVELYQGQAMASDVIDYLSKYGFNLAGVYNVNYDQAGIAIQADFLFRRGKDKV